MPPTESDIIKTIESVRTEMSTTINAGLRDIQQSIKNLEQGHNLALLEQERRNSTFADRERVEDVARNVHDAVNAAQTAILSTARYDKLIDGINTRLDRNAEKMDEAFKALTTQSMGLLSGVNGYLVSIVLIAVSGMLGFFLHLLH